MVQTTALAEWGFASLERFRDWLRPNYSAYPVDELISLVANERELPRQEISQGDVKNDDSVHIRPERPGLTRAHVNSNGSVEFIELEKIT